MTTKLTLLARTELESLYREYFIEIRKFSPFPMNLSYENVLDFAEWLSQRRRNETTRSSEGSFTGDAK